MKSNVLDLVVAWRKRGREIATPTAAADADRIRSTVGASARVFGRQLVVDVFSQDGDVEETIAFTPELAREWGHYFLNFAAKCSREDHEKARVASGLCASANCKRKLVAGTERCRKCGEYLAERLARAQAQKGNQP